jgi:hypothetical protein
MLNLIDPTESALEGKHREGSKEVAQNIVPRSRGLKNQHSDMGSRRVQVYEPFSMNGGNTNVHG